MKERKLLSDRAQMLVYPMGELAGGIYKSYFSTYISLLMTSVYIFPLVIAGVLESLMSIIEWIAAPIAGTFYDNFKSKKFKYWPWYIFIGGGAGIFYIIVFSMPVFSSDPSKLVVPAAIFIALAAFCVAAVSNLGTIIFARTAKNQEMRSFMSMAAKITRDGMKVLIGFLYPIMLVNFNNIMEEAKSWALIALILAGSAFILFCITAFMCRRTLVEKEGVEGVKKVGAKKPGFKASIEGIFKNPYLLICVLALAGSKIFFFFHISGASFFWKYYMADFKSMSGYMTAFSLCAIIGALLVPFAMKIFKDTKITYVVGMLLQAVFYVISLFIVSNENVPGTIAILCGASFFNGITDSLILSLFAGATDWAMWKTGTESVGLTMSTFSIAVRIGLLGSTVLRTSLLAGAGFDSKALAAGAAVPEAVKVCLRNMNTVYPLILSLVIAAMVFFGYRLSDKQLVEYRAEIKARKEAAEKAAAENNDNKAE